MRIMRCTYAVKPELDSARYTPTTDPGAFLSVRPKEATPNVQKNCLIFIYLLAMLHSMWDLSSMTSD